MTTIKLCVLQELSMVTSIGRYYTTAVSNEVIHTSNGSPAPPQFDFSVLRFLSSHFFLDL